MTSRSVKFVDSMILAPNLQNISRGVNFGGEWYRKDRSTEPSLKKAFPDGPISWGIGDVQDIKPSPMNFTSHWQTPGKAQMASAWQVSLHRQHPSDLLWSAVVWKPG
jgi:hypothetical protein